MKTNLQNESDSPIGNLTHQPSVTDESAGRPAGVSQQPYGGKNVSAPRRPWRFAPWLRGAALFVLAVFWLPAALQAQDFQYTISGGQVTITGYTGPGGDVTIPESIQGLPVIRIGDAAFTGCTNLASLTIPNSVTSIGPYAFSFCTGLANVTIPNSVTSIGNSAFEYCTSLANVTIPNSVISIGSTAFFQCSSLASVTIPNSVTSIADHTFSGCTSLTSVTIPNSVTSIARAFQRCTSLASVTIPNSVTSIGLLTFSDCTRLRSVYFMGNAPVDRAPFERSDRVTVYYRAGTTGWESTFSGRPAVLWIPEEDLDRDDMTNLQEFLAGTDPADAQSLLAFEGAARLNDLADEDKTALPPGQFALYFQSIPGQSYEIQFTVTLGAAWSQAATVAAGRATQKRVVLDRPETKGFYRLKLVAAE